MGFTFKFLGFDFHSGGAMEVTRGSDGIWCWNLAK